MLSNDADADDAFQATFLTLARSVKKLKPGLPLGPWLHRVAYHVCKNARRAKARRTKWEKASAQSEASRPVADSAWVSAFAAVAVEVQKLPEAQRAAFVLCCIEGRTTAEAAASLGQKIGTFSARLTRAKQTLLDRLATRGLGAGALALGGVTGSVAVAPAASIQRTLALIPSGVVIPSSVHGLMQGVTGMALIRFKVLAATVLVAAGLSLGVGSGWFSSASGQYVPRESAAQKGAKVEPNIEKLKADLERAKTELAKAEADAAKRAIDAEAEDKRRRLLDTMRAELPMKYEYESLPEKGMTPKDFEAKLAEREKNGWAFVGQVDLNTGDKKKAEPMLVFCKKRHTPLIDWQGRELLKTLDGTSILPVPATPTVPKLPKGPAVPKAVDPVSPLPLTPEEKTDERNGSLAQPQPRVSPLSLEGGYRIEAPFTQTEMEYVNRTAKLEKLVEELRAKGLTPTEKGVTVKFSKEDFGNWDRDELASLILKVMAGDNKTKAIAGAIQFDLSKDGLTAYGPAAALAAVAEWVKKLKK